jgi:hypothetical protein
MMKEEDEVVSISGGNSILVDVDYKGRCVCSVGNSRYEFQCGVMEEQVYLH